MHGTTVATNALLERKGATVGMLTTAGHRDIVEMREGLKDDRYNLRMPPPVPLVPRARRLDVRERMRFDGKVETPLDKALASSPLCASWPRPRSSRSPSATSIPTETGATSGPRVGFWRASSRRPTSSLSSEVLPQIKEYERFGTTVVNAYVGPVLAGYLGRLEMRLARGGLRRTRAHHAVAWRRRHHRGLDSARRRGRPVRPGGRRSRGAGTARG